MLFLLMSVSTYPFFDQPNSNTDANRLLGDHDLERTEEACPNCRKINAFKKVNYKNVAVGSGSIDASINHNQIHPNEVVVGMKIAVSKDRYRIKFRKYNHVSLLHLIVRPIKSNGTLGPARVIKANNGYSDVGPEISFEAPSGSVLTGVGLRVHKRKVNRAKFTFSKLVRDPNTCEIKLVNHGTKIIGDGGRLEQECYLSSNEISKKPKVITGIEVGAHKDDINILNIKTAEIMLR